MTDSTSFDATVVSGGPFKPPRDSDDFFKRSDERAPDEGAAPAAFPAGLLVGMPLGALAVLFVLTAIGTFDARENAHRAWCTREGATYMFARGDDGTVTEWCVPTDSARTPWRVP